MVGNPEDHFFASWLMLSQIMFLGNPQSGSLSVLNAHFYKTASCYSFISESGKVTSEIFSLPNINERNKQDMNVSGLDPLHYESEMIPTKLPCKTL